MLFPGLLFFFDITKKNHNRKDGILMIGNKRKSSGSPVTRIEYFYIPSGYDDVWYCRHYGRRWSSEGWFGLGWLTNSHHYDTPAPKNIASLPVSRVGMNGCRYSCRNHAYSTLSSPILPSLAFSFNVKPNIYRIHTIKC